MKMFAFDQGSSKPTLNYSVAEKLMFDPQMFNGSDAIRSHYQISAIDWARKEFFGSVLPNPRCIFLFGMFSSEPQQTLVDVRVIHLVS